MKYWFLEILKAFAIPTILILIMIIVFTNFIDINNQETSYVVLGIMLGVILGFTADLTKRGLDDLNKLQKMRKISLQLLEEDAEDIYRLVGPYKSYLKEGSYYTPPELDLKYWNLLKKDKEFLMLGVNEPFNEIFKMMWDFERIIYQIKEEKKKTRPYWFLTYESLMTQKAPKKLLLMFKTEQEIKEIDKKYAERRRHYNNKMEKIKLEEEV